MRPHRSTRYALQVAVCGLCLRSVDGQTDCYRQDRAAGGLSHVGCIAVIMTDGDGPQVSAAEMADVVNDAADELCSKLCENPEHPSTATECRHDIEMLAPNVAIGCSPDRPEDWAADHFHAVVDGAPCLCRHESAPAASQAHDQTVEG